MQASFFHAETDANTSLPGIPHEGRCCNLFTGDMLASKTNGMMGLAACTQQEWEEIWEHAGLPPPAPLPQGACAYYERRFDDKIHLDIDLVKLDDENKTIEWKVTSTPLESGEQARGFWSICIVPEDVKTQRYSYAENPSRSEQLAQMREAEKQGVAQSREKLARFVEGAKTHRNRFRL